MIGFGRALVVPETIARGAGTWRRLRAASSRVSSPLTPSNTKGAIPCTSRRFPSRAGTTCGRAGTNLHQKLKLRDDLAAIVAELERLAVEIDRLDLGRRSSPRARSRATGESDRSVLAAARHRQQGMRGGCSRSGFIMPCQESNSGSFGQHHSEPPLACLAASSGRRTRSAAAERSVSRIDTFIRPQFTIHSRNDGFAASFPT